MASLARKVSRSVAGRSLVMNLIAAWKLYDRQVEFIRSDALFNLFLAGVGAGKTYSLARWLVRKALINGRATGALLGRTNIDNASVLLPEVFDCVEQLQEAAGFNIISAYDKGNQRIHWFNGGVTYIRPYNRIAKVRGLTLTYAAADETEWSEADPEEIWSVFTGRLRGKGPYPGLAFATSPNGLRGITKKFYEAELAADDAIARGDMEALADAQQFRIFLATSYHNPNLPRHYFKALGSMSRRRHDQEVMGKVLRPLSSVFEVTNRHFVEWDWRTPEHRFMPWVCGVDWGTQNHHVALMFQVDPTTGVWVCADELICDDMPQGKFLQKLYAWVAERPNPPVLFGVDRAIVQCNQALSRRYPDTTVKWLESKEEQKVERGIEMVRDMLDPHAGLPKLLFARSLSVLVASETAGVVPAMRNYRYIMGPDGIPTRRPLKDNVNDHACDAVRYGLFGSARYAELHAGRVWLVDDGDHEKPDNAGKGHSLIQT